MVHAVRSVAPTLTCHRQAAESVAEHGVPHQLDIDALSETRDQEQSAADDGRLTCFGRIGSVWANMSALGVPHKMRTVTGSTTSTRSMPLTALKSTPVELPITWL